MRRLVKLLKKMKTLLVVLGLIGLGPKVLHSQSVQTNSYVSVLRYNLTSTSVIYCQGGESFRPSSGAVTTSGSSTTLTASAGATPFDGLVVGDALVFNVDPVLRMITAKASGSSVTISSAINLPNPTPFNFMHFNCGSGAEDGWMPMAKFGNTATLGFEINSQTTATGIDMRLECRSSAPDAQPIQAFPACSPGACNTFQTYVQTATGITARTAIAVPEPWKDCRVGMKITSTQTGPQSLNVYLMGRQ